MDHNFKKHDRWLALNYATIPNCVSPSPYHVFGLDDIDDAWYLMTTYKEDAKNER